MQRRVNPRYQTKDRAYITGMTTGMLEGNVLLKNLSITGCCLECTTCNNIELYEKYKIDIEPESFAGIGKFDIEVECKWIRKGDHSCEIGFQIVASPKGKCFQSYVDYLTYHSTSE